MANASKPSIFDRRAIGSEKELDEYGVWLKSESEELAVLEQDGSEDYNFPPFEEKSGPAADAYEEHTSVSDVSDATAAISGTSNPEATLSATLLLKIAEELALIKNELAALKSEVDRIHNERETSVPPPAVPVPSVPRPVADNLPAETEVTKDENAKVGFEDAGAREEKAAEYAAVVSEPVTEEPAAAVDEAAFDIFDGADTEDFAAEEKTANVENIPPEKDAAEAGTDFFGADKPDDETALSSGEQDLLGGDAAKNVDGNVEAPEDSFFAGGQDEEKSAVPGDAINGILSDLEIPAETALNEDAKVAETAFEDIPGEPASAESAAQPEAAASVPDEDLAIDGGAVDITSEAAEEAASDEPAALEAEAAGSLEEDAFNRDRFETEEDAETPDTLDAAAPDLRVEPAIEPEALTYDPSSVDPETADSLEEDAFNIDHFEREEDAETPDAPDSAAPDLRVEPAIEPEAFTYDPASVDPETADSLEEDAFNIDHFEREEDAETPDAFDNAAQDPHVEATIEPAALTYDPAAVDPETAGSLDDAAQDLRIEPEEGASFDDPAAVEPETEINFAENAFDIDDIDDIDIEIDGEAEEDEPIVAEPETADIPFDPFGSLPDEDVTDRADTEETASEDAPSADFSVIEDSSSASLPDETDTVEASDANDTPDTIDAIDANGTTGTNGALDTDSVTDAIDADGATGANGALDTDGTIDAIDANGTTDANGVIDTDGTIDAIDADGTTDANGALDTDGTIDAIGTDGTTDANGTTGTVDTIDTLDSNGAIGAIGTTDTAEPEPEDEDQAGQTVETAETPETADGERAGPDIAGADADPALSPLLDEGFHQFVPAPEDTAYLDDEKPLDTAEDTEPEDTASPEIAEASDGLDELDELSDESPEASDEPPDDAPAAPQSAPSGKASPALQGVPPKFREELRTVLSYMDVLLESLPDEKIEEFARSEHFEPYKKLFKELGLA